MGFIFIARPALAVDVREVQPILAGALEPRAPASLKCRCLTSLTELLRVEEDAMLARQAAARREAAAAHTASTMPEAETRALARRNGEGDTGSVTSGLIQMLWERIRALATDVTPAASAAAASGQTPPSTPSGSAVSAAGAGARAGAMGGAEVVSTNAINTQDRGLGVNAGRRAVTRYRQGLNLKACLPTAPCLTLPPTSQLFGGALWSLWRWSSVAASWCPGRRCRR